MFGIGLPEMILILALALIVVGPDKLPDLARSIAKGIMELKKTAEGLKDQISDEGNPLDEIRPDLEDAAKSFKSHMLDHPEKGKLDLFPDEGVNPPSNNAAEAYKELTQTGVNPANPNSPESTVLETSMDDLTEVVTPIDAPESTDLNEKNNSTNSKASSEK